MIIYFVELLFYGVFWHQSLCKANVSQICFTDEDVKGFRSSVSVHGEAYCP